MSKNKLIQKELSKVKVADISGLTEETYYCIIPKYIPDTYEVNKRYIVKLDEYTYTGKNYILNNNWNSNTYPASEYLKVLVLEKLNKKIKVESNYYDFNSKQVLNTSWLGWLDTDNLKIISKL